MQLKNMASDSDDSETQVHSQMWKEEADDNNVQLHSVVGMEACFQQPIKKLKR